MSAEDNTLNNLSRSSTSIHSRFGADHHKRSTGPILRDFKGDYDPLESLESKPRTVVAGKEL